MPSLADLASSLTEIERQSLISRLTVEGRRQMEALIRSTQLAVYQEWMSTGRFAQDVTQWGATYSRIVADAQLVAFTQTLALTAEHASLALGRAIGAPATQVASTAEWLSGANSISAESAQLRMRTKLIEGLSFDQASDEAGRFAHGQAARDLQTAQRQAGKSWNEQSEAKTLGWRKVPSGAACGWCVVVSDRLYREAETVPAHAHDRCGFSPVFAKDGWQQSTLDESTEEDVLDLPADPDAATLP